MNADESLYCASRLIHLVGDGHELLHRFVFSAFICVYPRLIAFSRLIHEAAISPLSGMALRQALTHGEDRDESLHQ
jgi:hypothetical protein